MKALIFNSGLGSRLGKLTASRPKSMLDLPSGESIFHRQLRVLSSCGIRDFVVTTGPFPEQIENCAKEFEGVGCSFSFVRNKKYAETNYIWSMWLARDLLENQEILLLHGDLVFDAEYVKKLLLAPEGSWGSVNRALPQPPKDFKARVVDGEIREVGVSIFNDECFAFQAMYRLDANAIDVWLSAVADFVVRGETEVYAENAANTVFQTMHVREFSYEGHVLDEIDTPEDLERVGAAIQERDWEDQPVLMLKDGGIGHVRGNASALHGSDDIPHLISAMGMSRPLVVLDKFFEKNSNELFEGALAGFPTFSEYSPNPTYEQVLEGVRTFRKDSCDGVISLGGGSAIDVAKCVRLWGSLPGDGTDECYADMKANYPRYPHLAIPTTAGTGSESTHFAVVYVRNKKCSVAHSAAQPSVALLAPSLLTGLPPYQKKATVMDALCQAIESHWSRKSSEASRRYSAAAIPMIVGNIERYLAEDADAARAMAIAANLAGKAINLTTTTAPHAMSYKLTSIFGYAHGHAVALCMAPCWHMLLQKSNSTISERLREIAVLMTGNENAQPQNGLAAFNNLLKTMAFERPALFSDGDLDVLASSINIQRLSNYPIDLSTNQVRDLYRRIVS